MTTKPKLLEITSGDVQSKYIERFLDSSNVEKVLVNTELASEDELTRLAQYPSFVAIGAYEIDNVTTFHRMNKSQVFYCKNDDVVERWENTIIEKGNKLEHLLSLGYSPTHADVVKLISSVDYKDNLAHFGFQEVLIGDFMSFLAPVELTEIIANEYGEMYGVSGVEVATYSRELDGISENERHPMRAPREKRRKQEGLYC